MWGRRSIVLTGSALAALALCAVSYVAIPKLTAGGAPSAPPILLGSPSAAPAILPSPAAMPVAPPAPVGHVTADLSAPPLPAPVDPEVAAATLHIPDNVPVDQLWQAGSTYYNARRPAEASAFFWKAASSGDARGAAALGTAYVRGDGVIADVDMGVFWLTKSAAAGNRGAQFVLGGIYEQGISVQQDLPRAFDYRMQSAKQSFVPAEKAIALDYEFGRGTQRDRQQAIYWMQQAAIAGDREAQTLVAVLNDQRTPPMQDEHQLQAFIQANPNIHLVAAAPPVVQRPAPPVAQPAQQQQQQQQATRQPAQTYAAASTPAKKPAQAQRRQPSAADIRQAQAVMGLMRQSMGFGGIFGGAINNSVGPKTWGGGGGGGGGDSGGNPCEYYNEYAACQAHKNGDDWAADRIERHEASGSEKDWYDQ
jgi:hypothetical protein